jgi:hypothetical protein
MDEKRERIYSLAFREYLNDTLSKMRTLTPKQRLLFFIHLKLDFCEFCGHVISNRSCDCD